jgi:hypothetical protein
MLNKSIAIVDDDPDLLNIFSEALKMSGAIIRFLVLLTLF